VTADMVDDWLRSARLRAANLFYLASDPNPNHRERALYEMTQALREALEEVRVVAEELRREGCSPTNDSRAYGRASEDVALPSDPPADL